jgi:formylglycine-generating enzyme required for sulfatase activity
MIYKYAILIGNSHFPSEVKLQNLRCPLSDVDGLEKVLINPNRGDFTQVVVLKDKRHDQVEHSLNRILNQAKKNDLVLVYYSGHGKQSKAGQLYLTSINTEIEVLNTTAVGLNKVYELLNDSTCQKIILVLDCCYSGAAGKAFKGDIDSVLQQVNTKSRGTYLITASTEIQVAEEKPEDRYSLFTKHLIAALATGAADKDGDGWITIDEWYQYVHDKVLDENKNQQPTKASTGERGELIIAKSGRNSREKLKKQIYQNLLKLSESSSEFAEILVEWVKLRDCSPEKFTQTQQKKYDLLVELVNKPLDPISFSFAWGKLNHPILVSPSPPPAPVKKEVTPPTVQKPKASITISQLRRETIKLFSSIITHITQCQHTMMVLKISAGVIALSVSAFAGIKVYEKFQPALKKEKVTKIIVNKTNPIVKKIIPVVSKQKVSPINSLVRKMILIKGGKFLMGSVASESDRDDDEQQHSVMVNDFYINQYEVTQALWQAIMLNNPAYFKGDQFPVENISWNQVQEFINKLNTKTAENYRLPTEIEWEYAVRSRTTTTFYTGNCIHTDQANYNGHNDYNNCGAKTGIDKQSTVAVGSYPPNLFNLYDMVGNVWEWTCSGYDKDYQRSGTPCLNKNNAHGSLVIRGGSWNDKPRSLRSASRSGGKATDRSNSLGFRLAKDYK